MRSVAQLAAISGRDRVAIGWLIGREPENKCAASAYGYRGHFEETCSD